MEMKFEYQGKSYVLKAKTGCDEFVKILSSNAWIKDKTISAKTAFEIGDNNPLPADTLYVGYTMAEILGMIKSHQLEPIGIDGGPDGDSK